LSSSKEEESNFASLTLLVARRASSLGLAPKTIPNTALIGAGHRRDGASLTLEDP